MSRPKSAPMGWQVSRSQHHLRLVFPRNPNSMYCQLHKKLNPKLQREDTQNDKDGTDATVKILYRQRTVRRAFSAQLKRPRKQLMEVTNRLAHFNPTFKPADSDRCSISQPKAPARCFPSPYNKPLYTREEVQNIVNRLHQSKNPDSGTLKLRNPKKIYTALSLEDIVESIQKRAKGEKGDKCPLRNPLPDNETNEHVLHCSKKYTAADVQRITDRIYKFDSMKWPPESKNVKARPSNKPVPPPPVGYVPPRKYSTKEVEAITERLHKFDPEKWPPNSRSRKQKDLPGMPRTYLPTWRRKGQKQDLDLDDLSDISSVEDSDLEDDPVEKDNDTDIPAVKQKNKDNKVLTKNDTDNKILSKDNKELPTDDKESTVIKAADYKDIDSKYDLGLSDDSDLDDD